MRSHSRVLSKTKVKQQALLTQLKQKRMASLKQKGPKKQPKSPLIVESDDEEMVPVSNPKTSFSKVKKNDFLEIESEEVAATTEEVEGEEMEEGFEDEEVEDVEQEPTPDSDVEDSNEEIAEACRPDSLNEDEDVKVKKRWTK